MKIRLLACVALGAAQVSACAITPNADLTRFADQTGRASFDVFNRSVDTPKTLVLPVQFDRQTEGPSCGAHVMASLVNYWKRKPALDGSKLFRQTPPKARSGYSMEELLKLAKANGLTASAVRIDGKAVIQELESGRPVITPVRLPSIYVQQRTIPVGEVPVIGTARNFLMSRSGRVSELTGMAMVSHYLLVIGYQQERFVVLDPVMGYRTISSDKLERYRKAFGNAAIVSAAASPAQAPARARSKPGARKSS